VRSRLRLGVLALLVAGVAVSVEAQPRGQQQGPPGARTDDMSPVQVHQLFDAMLVMQAQDALALSESQYAQFVSRLKALQDARRRHQQDRVRLIGELQRLTNPRSPKPADEAELTRRLSALQELESRQAADLRRAYDGIDEVLNPLQRARFRVLEEQIERRKLELVGRARQNNQRAPTRRPPGR
jgi:DNA repair exonuclease SbcCD ATPase subunit